MYYIVYNIKYRLHTHIVTFLMFIHDHRLPLVERMIGIFFSMFHVVRAVKYTYLTKYKTNIIVSCFLSLKVCFLLNRFVPQYNFYFIFSVKFIIFFIIILIKLHIHNDGSFVLMSTIYFTS